MVHGQKCEIKGQPRLRKTIYQMKKGTTRKFSFKNSSIKVHRVKRKQYKHVVKHTKKLLQP